jgi:hypothetical protein
MTFSPRKIFNPVAGLFFISGICISSYQLIISGAIRSSGIILIISALIVFLYGILAEQLAHLRRDLNK